MDFPKEFVCNKVPICQLIRKIQEASGFLKADYETSLMSPATMLLFWHPKTLMYVEASFLFVRHHTQFHQRNFSSSKSVRINHNTNSDTYFPLFLVGQCLTLIPVINIHFFSLYIIRSHLTMIPTTVSFLYC